MKHSVNELRSYWVVQKSIALQDFIVLALHVLQKNRTQFLHEANHFLTPTQYATLASLLERRSLHEPVAYLTGRKEFFGREFQVTSDTLIPRPDSECLIEDILKYSTTDPNIPSALFDIGTGSGALAITLRKELGYAPLQVFASDISPEALRVAQKNADVHHAPVTFLGGSLLEPHTPFLASQKYLYIIANLPYVSEFLFSKTEPDVQNYEPTSALVSEDGGLAHYKQLLKEIQTISTSISGVCWLEISPEQSNSLTEEIKHIFPATEICIGQDLAHRNRFLRFTF